MGWGGVAKQRTKVIDLPKVIEAAVVPDGRTKAGRDVYRWQFDGYGIVSVNVYLPAGEKLPADGITLSRADFDDDLGTDKPRRGSEVGGYRDASVGGEGEALSIYVEAPKNYDHFEAVHIEHA